MFATPQLLWLLLLAPVGGLGAAWLWRRRLAASAAWAARGLWDRLLPGVSVHRLWAMSLLGALGIGATVLALARPRWGESHQTVERQGIDIVFLLDTSLSMSAPDVKPSRLWVAQGLIRRLVEALPGNRVGLVQFEGEGLTLAPLTLDAAVIDLLLDAVAAGSLPAPGSELVPGLDRALTLFPAEGKKHRAMVVVSDGEDHGGHLDQAIAKLVEERITVFSLGIGSPEGAPLPVPGQPGAYKRDQEGKVVISRLGEPALERLAKETGGVYLRATHPGLELTPVIDGLRAIEGRSLAAETVATLEERFQLPLGAAVFVLAIQVLVGAFPRHAPGHLEPARSQSRRPA